MGKIMVIGLIVQLTDNVNLAYKNVPCINSMHGYNIKVKLILFKSS